MYLRGRKSIFYVKLTLFVFCLFFISDNVLQALGTTKAVQKDGLVTQFTFDSAYTFGTTTYDKSGRRNNGVMVNGPSITNGKFGQGMLFNGNDTYVTLPTTGASTTTGSISFWAYATTTQSSGYLVNTIGTNQRIYFNYLSSNNINFTLGSIPTQIAVGSAPLGKWYHVVGKWNGTVGSLYLNGVFVGSSTFSGLTSILNPMYVGSFAGSQGFNGIIDDVRFYNKDLSTSEILTLYKTGTNISVKNSDNTNLLGYWPLNGNYNDYSGKRNHFTVNGTCVATSSDAVTGSISATGWGGCGTSPNLLGYLSTGNIFSSATEFTYVVWVKGTGVLWSGAPTFWLRTTATGANLEKYTSSWVPVASGDGGGTSSIWRQIVLTKNSSGGVKIYSNGAEIASSTTQSFYTPTSQTLGRYAVYDDGSYHFTGKIDDARLYSRVLSISEIKELYKMKPASVAPSKTKVSTVLSGPIVHHTFDGSKLNNTTSTDSGSAQIHGTRVGSLSAVSGKLGQALKFKGNGSGTYINLGTSTTLNPGNFTIASWVYQSSSTVGYGYIYSNARDCCGTYNGVELRYENGYARVIIWNGTPVQLLSAYQGLGIKWRHITATYDGSFLRIYIDGVLSNSVATALGVGSPASYPAAIGGMGHAPGSYTFNGKIDDFRLYDRVLSASEIYKIYQLGGR